MPNPLLCPALPFSWWSSLSRLSTRASIPSSPHLCSVLKRAACPKLGASLAVSFFVQLACSFYSISSLLFFFIRFALLFSPGFSILPRQTALYSAANASYQCDETHPACNNCKKSKRDCLGYDPIFRQQPGGQPGANLQPSTGSPTAAGALPVSPSSRHLNSYGSQPAILPNAYTSSPALQPTSNHHTPSPQLKPDAHYGYPPNPQPSRYYSPTSSYDAPRNLEHKPLPPPHALAPAQRMYNLTP